MKCKNGRCYVSYRGNRKAAKFIAAVILAALVMLVAAGNLLTERLMRDNSAENTAIYMTEDEAV